MDGRGLEQVVLGISPEELEGLGLVAGLEADGPLGCGAEVVVEITAPSSPGVLKPVSKDGYIHVVMPMFVQW